MGKRMGEKIMIGNENYYVVQGWMRSELHLKGNELNVFAVIHGFSQADDQWFTGSSTYLADFVGCDKGTVLDILSRLVEKNFIIKEDRVVNNVKFCKYRTNFIGRAEATRCEKDTTGGKMTPNNKDLLLLDEIINKNLNMGCEKDTTGGEITPPLHDAIVSWLKYKRERGQSYKRTGLEQLLQKIVTARTAKGEKFVIEKIEHSIASNYQGVFFDDNKPNQKKGVKVNYDTNF
jgi:DNA-binding Lrp family transcriptional regulator